ncbi:MAG: AAA family ATPase [Elusimicrobia bacterium]|nr:AAA family ATPase [Elusimicrobiota bacterium]
MFIENSMDTDINRPLPQHIFITGTVGVGKTTLIKESLLPWIASAGGFYTEEVRTNGRRQGFMLKTLHGEETLFALKGRKNPHRIGKYGVDINAFEEIGVSALEDALKNKKIIVIDEIGSMELLSPKFHEVFLRLLSSDRNLLATIRLNSQPFTDDISRFERKKMFHLSHENFVDIKKYIQWWLGRCSEK